MKFNRVAVVAPGDMGHAVGRVMADAGRRVVTNLAGRSARSRSLAAAAGIVDLGEDAALLDGADLVLSIMPPDQAVGFAHRLAAACERTAARPVLCDLNAVAPATAEAAAAVAGAAGLPFVDGGIVGGPPANGKSPRLYVSGPGAADLLELNRDGLDFRVLEAGIGGASAIKMCYASITKGLTTLAVQSLIAGRAHGVEEALLAELASSRPGLLRHIEQFMPGMPPKAYRWVGEMEEIARTFGDLGLTPKTFEGAADTYRFIENTPLGQEIVEDRKLGTDVAAVTAILHQALPRRPE